MLDRLNNSSCYFEVEQSFVIRCDLLNPDFNCSKNFVLFSFDKVITGTYNFVSLILNSSASLVNISTKTQLFDQLKINSTSKL